MKQFLNEHKASLVSAAAGAATTEVDSAVVDMQGMDDIVFVGSIGTSASGNVMKVQQGNAADGSDMADLAGSSTVFPGNGKTVVTEVYRPLKRYVRAVVLRPTSSTVGDIYAFTRAKNMPPTNTVANTITSKILISPDEGTA